MTLQIRKVNIDFSDARIHWNPWGPEFSHVFNAFSSLAPELEPFLIKTMRAAKGLLPISASALHDDIDVFNSQEGKHYRMHAGFNKLLYAEGYQLKDSEEKLRADYERYLEQKGVKFCVAYSEGFETLGPALSGFFFDRTPEVLEQWDEPTTFLWLWHVAEEYEHRAVVNGTYNTLYGGYWYRIYGLWFALIHIFAYVIKNSNRMIKADRESGRIPDVWASRWRHIKTFAGLARYAAPRLLIHCHKPSYDPTRYPPIEGAQVILARASERYGVA